VRHVLQRNACCGDVAEAGATSEEPCTARSAGIVTASAAGRPFAVAAPQAMAAYLLLFSGRATASSALGQIVIEIRLAVAERNTALTIGGATVGLTLDLANAIR
jgi:hypothetical protein